MKEIKLACGRITVMDDEDFERFKHLSWRINKDGYAETKPGGRKAKKRFLLHRMILGVVEGQFVDHRNRDRLDNQKSNLRVATKAQNQHNRGKNKANTTGYKGVRFDKRRNTFVAVIGFEKKVVWLGSYKTAQAAHEAYAEAARELHKEFARIE